MSTSLQRSTNRQYSTALIQVLQWLQPIATASPTTLPDIGESTHPHLTRDRVPDLHALIVQVRRQAGLWWQIVDKPCVPEGELPHDHSHAYRVEALCNSALTLLRYLEVDGLMLDQVATVLYSAFLSFPEQLLEEETHATT